MNDVLLIGVGHPDRGDDAVGPAIVRAVRGACPDGVRAIEAGGDLLALLDLWAGARGVVVVDATRGAGMPGRIVRLTPLERASSGLAMPAFVSSHALDLASVLDLGRALGRVPRELVVYGVEGERFGGGEPLSAEVAAAMPRVIDQVMTELSRLAAGSPCTNTR